MNAPYLNPDIKLLIELANKLMPKLLPTLVS